MAPADPVVIRLTADLQNLTRQVEKLAAAVDDLQSTLNQARGGVVVLRWLGFGSLASFLGLAALVYQWLGRGH